MTMRPEQGTLISRAQAMAALLELLTDQPVIVCNGFPSREAQKIADRPTHFYMIGSMGNAPAIAFHIGHHGDEARGHFREVDVCVADRRIDRLGDFPNVRDAKGHPVPA